MKLLLHICCAPCSAACVKVLREEKIDITGYWYNPNIHPYKEYENRLNALKEYSKMINLKVIYNDYYGLREFTSNVIDKIDNRCEYCYFSRMENVVKYAKDNGYDAFTSTLFISPYQKHDLLKKICENLSKKYNIEFKYIDFRPYYYEGKQMFYETGLYMQKYCGCIFSEEIRYLSSNNKKPNIPENLNFPIKKSICVKKLDNKNDYIDFLIEADPLKNNIYNYLNDSIVYGLKVDDEIISLAVVLEVDKNTLELKNLFTRKEYRKKGYAKRLLKSLCGNYKQKYNKMLVGTTENYIPFYVKQGFDKYEKTIKNYFSNNYEEEICNEDFYYTDIIYYSKDLKK